MNLLDIRNLDKRYVSVISGRTVHAVDQVSFSLAEGQFSALVGESGSGKSTLAKLIAGLLTPDAGEILLEARPLAAPYPKAVYKRLQMIFQLPRESFNPRKTIGNSLIEMQRNFGASRPDALRGAERLLGKVGLGKKIMGRYPHQMSGGECQRAAIARALTISPKLIVCDEITSALDVSVQAQIVALLQRLRKDFNLSLLFISHDLALVQGFCDRIMVMRGGVIVEDAATENLMKNPRNEYTAKLFSSAFDVAPASENLLEH